MQSSYNDLNSYWINWCLYKREIWTQMQTQREDSYVKMEGLALIRSSAASQAFIFKPYLPGCEEGPFIKAREKSVFCLTQLTYFISLIPVNL